MAAIKFYRFFKTNLNINNNINNNIHNNNNNNINNNNNETNVNDNNNNINAENVSRIFQDLAPLRSDTHNVDATFSYSALLQKENDSKIEIINDITEK